MKGWHFFCEKTALFDSRSYKNNRTRPKVRFCYFMLQFHLRVLYKKVQKSLLYVMGVEFRPDNGSRYAAIVAATRPRACQPFTERSAFCKQNRPVRSPSFLTSNIHTKKFNTRNYKKVILRHSRSEINDLRHR